MTDHELEDLHRNYWHDKADIAEAYRLLRSTAIVRKLCDGLIAGCFDGNLVDAARAVRNAMDADN